MCTGEQLSTGLEVGKGLELSAYSVLAWFHDGVIGARVIARN